MNSNYYRLAILVAIPGLFGCAGRTPEVIPAAHGLTATADSSHTLFSDILQDHTRAGKVDYETLCRDDRLEQYLAQLAATDPADYPNQQSRLAFWINVYNAYTLKVICENYPLDSINELHFGGFILGHVLKKTIWDKKFVVVDGKNISLNYLEHKIIRGRKQQAEAPFAMVCAEEPCPRAHFALVCASKSCPALRSEAYEGASLNRQLDDQARIFFSDENKNAFDTKQKTAELSKILDWYGGDFGRNDKEVLSYVAQFLPQKTAESILANPGKWRLKYKKYDWSLNE